MVVFEFESETTNANLGSNLTTEMKKFKKLQKFLDFTFLISSASSDDVVWNVSGVSKTKDL